MREKKKEKDEKKSKEKNAEKNKKTKDERKAITSEKTEIKNDSKHSETDKKIFGVKFNDKSGLWKVERTIKKRRFKGDREYKTKEEAGRKADDLVREFWKNKGFFKTHINFPVGDETHYGPPERMLEKNQTKTSELDDEDEKAGSESDENKSLHVENTKRNVHSQK